MSLSIVEYLNVQFVLGVFLLFVILYQLYLHPLWFSPLRNLPGPPYGNVLLGQSLNIAKAEPDILQIKWAKEYGPIVRAIGPLGFEHLTLISPTALEKVLITDWMDYPKPDFFWKVLGFGVGYGLLATLGDEHKVMRRAMNPAFALSNLIAKAEMYYPPLEGLVRILYAKIQSESAPDKGTKVLIYDWLTRTSLDIICAVAFGYHPDTLHDENSELASAYRTLFNLQTGYDYAKFGICVTLIPGFHRFLRTDFAYKYRKFLFPGVLEPLRKLHALLESVHSIMEISKLMLEEKMREASVKGSTNRKDILSLLLQARMNETEEGYKATDQELLEQVLTFLGPGHGSNASGSSWTLWLLATHPVYQDRLRAEVLPVIEANPRPSYSTLKQLPLLHAIVMESLRIFPPAPMTMREAAKDDWIDGHFVPKGTVLYIPIRAVNTYAGIWGPDADQFRPERWSNLPPTYNSKLSWLSFTAGAYSCIARNMGIMELKAMIAVLVAHFIFEPAYEGQRPHPIGARSMKPRDSLPMRVKAVGKLPIPQPNDMDDHL